MEMCFLHSEGDVSTSVLWSTIYASDKLLFHIKTRGREIKNNLNNLIIINNNNNTVRGNTKKRIMIIIIVKKKIKNFLFLFY